MTNQVIGKVCMVRTYSAGVFFGTLKERNGKEVVLTDARRIWYARWIKSATPDVGGKAVAMFSACGHDCDHAGPNDDISGSQHGHK